MVNETMPKKVYDISSSTKPLSTGYDIPFSIGKKEELHVYVSSLKGDSEVDSGKYKLTSDTKGEVATHLTFVASYTFPTGSTKLTLIREVAIRQEISLKEGEKISAKIIEEGLDNSVRIALTLQEQVGRAILVSRSDEGSQIVVPNATDRAGHMLAFDEDGNLAPVLTSDVAADIEAVQACADSAEASMTAAALSATNAATSEENAKTSETNAKESETNAEASKTSVSSMKASVEQTKADIESDIAQAKADIATAKSEGISAVKAQETSSVAVIQTHVNDAKTYAEQAETNASSASTSETNAKESETKASASETNAKTSETNAKESETNAKASEDNAKDSETAVSSMKADIQASKAELEGEIATAKSDIATAKADAVDTISTDKTSAVSAIQAKKTESVEAVENAESTALSNISTNKASAISAIQSQKESSLSALQSQETSSKTALQAYETRVNTAVTKAETSETNAKDSADKAEASATKLDTLKSNVSFSVDSSNSRIYHLSFWDDQVASFTIPADKFLKSASYDEATQKLKFVFVKADESEDTIYVDISSLVDTYTAGNGLQVASNQFSVKIKTGETHFKADSNGIYLDLSDKADASHTHTKSQITDFTHYHDDRYYTETEINTKLSTINTSLEGKSNTGHTHTKSEITDFSHDHDDRYYTEDETDELLSGKSDSSHTHDERYYTEAEVDSKLALKSDTAHTHDGRYYTETEIDEKVSTLNTKINGKSATGHTHTKSEITDFAHNHDERYYTETEIDTKVSALNTSIANKQTSALVTEFQTTPDDTHYPSEKLVKDSIDSISSSLSTHTANVSNPHSVTKAQVGLGNVLNVASYSKTEVDTKLSGKSDTSHLHDTRYYTKDEVDDKIAGADVDLSDYYNKSQIDTKVSALNTSIAGKANSSHSHTKSQITDFPTSLPASDVSAWAKATTKPTYTYSEVGAAAESHNHDSSYYKKSETYTRTEIETKISAVSVDLPLSVVGGKLCFEYETT